MLPLGEDTKGIRRLCRVPQCSSAHHPHIVIEAHPVAEKSNIFIQQNQYYGILLTNLGEILGSTFSKTEKGRGHEKRIPMVA